MGQNNDERRTENGGAVFDGAEGRSVYEIAGVPRDEQFADAAAAEDQLWGTRLSAQLMIVAQGAWCVATARRRSARSIEQSSGWLT